MPDEQPNLMGISDRLMVEQLHAEATAGNAGVVTVAFFEKFGNYGFVLLKREFGRNLISDIDREDISGRAVENFRLAILQNRFEVRGSDGSSAYYATICRRRAIDFLRQKGVATRTETPATAPLEYEMPHAAAVYRFDESFDQPQQESISAWMDVVLIWEIIEKKLGDACKRVLELTIVHDLKHDETARLTGSTPDGVKTKKAECLKKLRTLLGSA